MHDHQNKRPRTTLSNPRPAILFGFAVIIFGLGTFGGWSAFSKLSSAIIGSGTVKVSSNRKIVQSPETGTIRDILVRNGQKVSAGDVLIRLDDTKARASFDVIQSRYDLTQATVARLRAELNHAESITFPDNLLFRRSNSTVSEILQSQRRLFKARRNSQTGQMKVLREKTRQLRGKIAGLSAQAEAVANRIEISNDEHNMLKQLLDRNLVSRSRVLELERSIAQLNGEKGNLEAQIAAAEAEIAQSSLQILQLPIAFEEAVNDDLSKNEGEMYALAQQVLDARHTLDQKIIRATENGTVVELAVHTLGEVIEPGATLLQIVPVKDDLIIDTRIRPEDIDSVVTGLDTDIVFPGFSKREIPRILGKVTYVSADALTDVRSGAPYFAAHVEISQDQLEKLGEHVLVPGMPAEVFIKTGEQTPIAYLTEPLRQSFRQAWREP